MGIFPNSLFQCGQHSVYREGTCYKVIVFDLKLNFSLYLMCFATLVPTVFSIGQLCTQLNSKFDFIIRSNACLVHQIDSCHNLMCRLVDCCWLVRGSLFIELGCTRDLGKGWRGDLGTFMISRSIKLKSDWLKVSIWNGVMGK